MNRKRLIRTITSISLLVIAQVLFFCGSSYAAGLLTPKDSQFGSLEIAKHNVEVVIESGYAITTVNQSFYNPHTQDLEAIYSFPVPEKGTVSEFTIWIDGKPVSGEVLEKKQARQIYETEKQAGRDAGLTEKNDYKTFDISVSPIRAGQETRIRFQYMQAAHVDTGMGRYVYPLEEGGVDEEKLAFWTANESVKEQFSFNMKLRSAYPVDALRMPNQAQALISQSGPGEWQVELGSANQEIDEETGIPANVNQPVFTLDKDLVVYWRHKAGLPGSVDLTTYKAEGDTRGTFMLTITPGDDLKPVHEGSDWIFVLDISGSMAGKYDSLVQGVQQALGKMRAEDRFRIITFNDSASEVTRGYVNATPENITHYGNMVASVNPGGSTNLYSGLLKGLNHADADRTSAIVLVTDGVANVGETKQRKFIQLLEKKDIRLFTFMMGNSANRPLLNLIARKSNGFASSISNSDDIIGKILEASSKVSHQALHGVELSIDGARVSDITPKESGSLYRGQQLIVFGHYFGEGDAQVKLKGKISGEKKEYHTRVDFPALDEGHPELERLWAYVTIERLNEEIQDFGEDADIRQAITDIATEYSLVTDYTSMVVVKDEVFDTLGIKRNNKKRLEIEQSAQQKRTTQPAVSKRADSQQPMFNSNRPSHNSGSGSMDAWLLLLVLPALLRRRLEKAKAV
ncbi:MAG: VWA domain-containing protein [Gammaproteobacteria bacterium]|nr:VWA domain-containing protein [Gammaproteobacteria bacterium]